MDNYGPVWPVAKQSSAAPSLAMVLPSRMQVPLDVQQVSVQVTPAVRNTLVNGNVDAVTMVAPEVSHAVHYSSPRSCIVPY